MASSGISKGHGALDEKTHHVIPDSSSGEPPVKQHYNTVTRGEPIPSSGDIDDNIVGYDGTLMGARTRLSSQQEKKLLRRIDWHLIPLLSVMYMVKSIDASNVSNARIMDRGTPRNIMTELNISADDYNFVTMAYYLSDPVYPGRDAFKPLGKATQAICLASKNHGWSLHLVTGSPVSLSEQISWGIVLVCHAAVTNAAGLYTVRAFLGLFEAGLWPGMLLQLCYWYRPDEMASRIVLVTILGNFSAVVSGVLAFAFNGVHAQGLSGWKWLILTEGVFTILLGIYAYIFMPDFPDTARWMSDEEKAFVQARLPINAPRAAEKDFDWTEFWNTLKDHKLWLFLLCWAFYTIGTTGLNFYQPTVIANLGFTGIAEAQLLNIPPAIFACVLTIVFGWVANTGRFPLPLIPLSFMIIIEACYVVLYTFPNTGGVYAATVIAGGFSIAWYTMMWPWRVQTTDGATGSAFAIAFANSYGQIGGAVGSQLFNSRFAPRYTTSFGIAMGFIGMAIVMNVITWSFTWKVDVATRRLKRARDAAAKRNEAILDDVDIHAKT
ncbi:tartrate transporter [Fusarium sp. NRRL 25303]|nr:tartrate transporter [Fusarium sp. NRRL 25303]